MNNNENGKRKEKQNNSILRQEVKFIENMRENLIKERMLLFDNEYKEKINLEKDDGKKKILKKQWKEDKKNIFKNGVSLNTEDYIIELSSVNKYYTSQLKYEHILKDINLKIKKGTITIILGTSGSGKSTLLNILSGLIDTNNGDVIVSDRNLLYLNEEQKTKFRAENVSFVFQSYNLIPTLTVKENINVGYNLRNKGDNEISVDYILEILDLEKQKDKYPFQLSGGQNQRISIGRALAKNPKILFADEPTGALDEEKGKEALQSLLDINEKFNTTIIMVTHNPSFVHVGDQTIVIKNGQIVEFKENKKKLKAKEIKW